MTKLGKSVSFLAALLLLFAIFAPPLQAAGVEMVFTLNSLTYTVDGEVRTMDVAPLSIEGRTMLPIRYAADPLDAEIAWEGATQKVTVTLGDTVLELWVGLSTARLNGVPTSLNRNFGTKRSLPP